MHGVTLSQDPFVQSAMSNPVRGRTGGTRIAEVEDSSREEMKRAVKSHPATSGQGQKDQEAQTTRDEVVLLDLTRTGMKIAVAKGLHGISGQGQRDPGAPVIRNVKVHQGSIRAGTKNVVVKDRLAISNQGTSDQAAPVIQKRGDHQILIRKEKDPSLNPARMQT